jgi:hypothetical protein
MHRRISHSWLAGQKRRHLNKLRAAMGPPIKSGDDDASRAMTTFGRIRTEAALTAEMLHFAVTIHVEPEDRARNFTSPGQEISYR